MEQDDKEKEKKEKMKEIQLPSRAPMRELRPSLNMTPEQLKLRIMKQNVSSSMNNIVIALQSPYSFCQLQLPVRNMVCPCLWEMSEIVSEQIFDEEDERLSQSLLLCYYCKASELDENGGRRYVEHFFIDKELAMYIGRAKQLYDEELRAWYSRHQSYEVCEQFCLGIYNIVFDALGRAPPKHSLKHCHLQPKEERDSSVVIDRSFVLNQQHCSNLQYQDKKKPKEFKYGQIKIVDLGGKVVTYHLKLKDGTELQYLLKDDRRNFADFRLTSHRRITTLNNYVSLSTSLSFMEKHLNNKMLSVEKWKTITRRYKQLARPQLEVEPQQKVMQSKLQEEKPEASDELECEVSKYSLSDIAMADRLVESIIGLFDAGDEMEFTFAFNQFQLHRDNKLSFSKRRRNEKEKVIAKQLYLHVMFPFKAAYYRCRLVRIVDNKLKEQPRELEKASKVVAEAVKEEQSKCEQVQEQKVPQVSQVQEKKQSTQVNTENTLSRDDPPYRAFPYMGLIDKAIFLKDKKKQKIYVVGAQQFEEDTKQKGDQKVLPASKGEEPPKKLLSGKCFFIELPSEGSHFPRKMPIGDLPDLPAEYNPIGAAGVVHNDILYVFGGVTPGKEQCRQMRTLDLRGEYVNYESVRNLQWRQGKPLPESRIYHTCLLHNNKVYLVGGTDKIPDRNQKLQNGQTPKIDLAKSILQYDIDTGDWRRIPLPSLSDHLSFGRFVACRLSTNEYLLLNGSHHQSCRLTFESKSTTEISCNYGGQNIPVTVEDAYATVQWQDPSEKQPIRPRQIFDPLIEPIYGIYYIMAHNNRDGYVRVVYGNQHAYRVLVADSEAASNYKNISQKVMQKTTGAKKAGDISDSSLSSFIY